MSRFSSVISHLSPAQRAILERRLGERRNKAQPKQEIFPRADPNNCPLSFAQRRLWFLDQLEPGSPLYNVLLAISMDGLLNVEALCQTLSAIVARHEVLRTSFVKMDGEPSQVIAESRPVEMPVIDLNHVAESLRGAEAMRLAIEESRRGFDLARGPLFRASLLRLSEREHILLLTMHHIVSDGWSVEVLVREMSALYAASSSGQVSTLAELPIQYVDYAVWQREWSAGREFEAELSYWREQLPGLSAMELPADWPRQPLNAFRSAVKPLTFSKSLSESIKLLSRSEGATLFMTLLAAFAVLLYRYCPQEDIVVGTNVANRKTLETEALIGCFVNQLVLRADLAGDPSFKELLGRVRATTLDAHAHQHLPFDRLVEELRPERDISRPLMFQIKFDLQSIAAPLPNLPGLVLNHLDTGQRVSRYDLHLSMVHTADGLTGELIYNPLLFRESRIEGMSRQFETLLESIAADSTTPLSRLVASLVEADREQATAEEREVQAASLRKLQSIKRKPVSSQPFGAAIR